MTYYPDLSPYEHTNLDASALNVGWLNKGEEFPTGDIPPDLLDVLIRLAAAPFFVTRGVHDCEFCEEESPQTVWTTDDKVRALLGFSEIHLRGARGIRFAAPTLVVHYIAAHNYLPPVEFLEALQSAELIPELQPLGTLAPATNGMSWRASELDRSSPLNKSERRNVIQYLEGCPTIESWMCATEDEIGGKFGVSGGCNLASDGTYYWRLDAIEYVRHYGIRVQEDALFHFELHDWTAPELTGDARRAVAWELERMFPN